MLAVVVEVADVSGLWVDVLVSILGGIRTGEGRVEGCESTGGAVRLSACFLVSPCSLSDGGRTSAKVSTCFSASPSTTLVCTGSR